MDCVINGRSRFIGRFESDVLWGAVLTSSANGVCRGIGSHTKQVLGQPSSTDGAWQEWTDEENERFTGYKEKTFCQVVHAQTGRDE